MASYHMHRHSYVSEHYVESESVCGGQTGARWLDVLYMISLSHTSLWYWWLRVLLMTANYILIYHVTTSSRPWTPNHEIEPTRKYVVTSDPDASQLQARLRCCDISVDTEDWWVSATWCMSDDAYCSATCCLWCLQCDQWRREMHKPTSGTLTKTRGTFQFAILCQFATWTFRTFGRFDTRTFLYLPGRFATGR